MKKYNIIKSLKEDLMKGRLKMIVTFDIKQVALLILYIALIVLAISLTVFILRAMKTLRRVDSVLNDTKKISRIASARTKEIDDLTDRIIEILSSLSDMIRGNFSVIDKFTGILSGVASIKSILDDLKVKDVTQSEQKPKMKKENKVSKNYRPLKKIRKSQ